LVLIALLVLPSITLAGRPTKSLPPVINSVYVDLEANLITIEGTNLTSPGVTPLVTLGADEYGPIELTIDTFTDSLLATLLPSEWPSGDYLLTVDNGSNIATFALTVGAVMSNQFAELSMRVDFLENGQINLQKCDGIWAALDTDENNCGSCGNVCASGEICQSGVCVLAYSPPEGLVECGGTFTFTSSDESNCGSCGNSCSSGEICQDGNCVLSCQVGLINCNGVCVNPYTDENYCGASGNCSVNNDGNVCASGEICQSGVCVLAYSPPEGLDECGGTYTFISIDESNCGSCDNRCLPGEICNNGTCELSCQIGLVNCGGRCIDPNTDQNHCGASGDCRPTTFEEGRICNSFQICKNAACLDNCIPQ
jgi:hypothetical protein